MPYMDRSLYLDELKRNPALMTRLLTIVNGEVGHNAPDWVKTIQLETIFNRATARGQSLHQVTLGTHESNRGYYPPETFRNGAPRPGEQERFNTRILQPVLSGSDVSTERLGFAATGNASAGVAARGKLADAAGRRKYTQHADVQTGAGTETYVQEGRGGRTGFDDITKLEATRVGAPPRDIPQTDQQAALGDVFTAGARPIATPGTMPGSSVSGVTGPLSPVATQMPPPAPEPQAAPAAASAPTAPARSQDVVSGLRKAVDTLFTGRGGGGQAGRIGFPGSRDDIPIDAAGLGTYVDPNTGHTIRNPTGSGELAMGVTRDLGRTSPRPPAPAPRATGPQSPPDRRPATGNPPAGPVSPTPRPTEKIAPFPETSGVTTDEMQRRDLPLSPFSAPVAANEPPTGPLAVHDPIGMFDVKQPAPGRDLVPGLLALTGGGVPPAPEIAGLLATALRSPAPPQDQNQNVASAAFQSGGTPMTPAYLPTTVGQQTLGLSPFMANMPREFQPPGPQQADLSPFRTTPEQSSFPSTSLLPFQQWPPVTFDWAGPYNFNAWG